MTATHSQVLKSSMSSVNGRQGAASSVISAVYALMESIRLGAVPCDVASTD